MSEDAWVSVEVGSAEEDFLSTRRMMTLGLLMTGIVSLFPRISPVPDLDDVIPESVGEFVFEDLAFVASGQGGWRS